MGVLGVPVYLAIPVCSMLTPWCWFPAMPSRSLSQGRDPYNTLIADEVVVPPGLAPGSYVLGIRWDCEKSTAASTFFMTSTSF